MMIASYLVVGPTAELRVRAEACILRLEAILAKVAWDGWRLPWRHCFSY